MAKSSPEKLIEAGNDRIIDNHQSIHKNKIHLQKYDCNQSGCHSEFRFDFPEDIDGAIERDGRLRDIRDQTH